MSYKWVFEWKNPNPSRLKNEKQVNSKVKSMMFTSFDIKGSVQKEFILAGQTVSSAYYCDILRRLREDFNLNFGEKELALASRPCAVSHFLFHQGFSNQIQHDCHPHPPYSPDLAPCNFLCFLPF
jgi:hypothetical protein